MTIRVLLIFLFAVFCLIYQAYSECEIDMKNDGSDVMTCMQYVEGNLTIVCEKKDKNDETKKAFKESLEEFKEEYERIKNQSRDCIKESDEKKLNELDALSQEIHEDCVKKLDIYGSNLCNTTAKEKSKECLQKKYEDADEKKQKLMFEMYNNYKSLMQGECFSILDEAKEHFADFLK